MNFTQERDRVLKEYEDRYATFPPMKDERFADHRMNTAGGHGFVRSDELASGERTIVDVDNIAKNAGPAKEDQARAELLRNTMYQGAKYGGAKLDGDKTAIERTQVGYMAAFQNLIDYDKQHGHPVADFGRPISKGISDPEREQWLNRGSRMDEKTTEERTFSVHGDAIGNTRSQSQSQASGSNLNFNIPPHTTQQLMDKLQKRSTGRGGIA